MRPSVLATTALLMTVVTGIARADDVYLLEHAASDERQVADAVRALGGRVIVATANDLLFVAPRAPDVEPLSRAAPVARHRLIALDVVALDVDGHARRGERRVEVTPLELDRLRRAPAKARDTSLGALLRQTWARALAAGGDPGARPRIVVSLDGMTDTHLTDHETDLLLGGRTLSERLRRVKPTLATLSAEDAELLRRALLRAARDGDAAALASLSAARGRKELTEDDRVLARAVVEPAAGLVNALPIGE